MQNRVSLAAQRAVRSALRFGATRLASSEWMMTAAYDLMNEANFEGLSNHEEMLNDHERVDFYHRGIHRHVRADDVVVDVGTGTGLLAFFASRAGARKIYAVEHSDLIEVAEEIAAHNNIANVAFVRANSREFEAPEPVDVLVHEQMGDELFNENMVQNLLDLRDRVMQPGGRILPARFRLFIEPVVFHESFRVRRFWNTELPDDIDLTRMRASALQHDNGRMEVLWIRPGSVASTVGTPEPVLEFDLHTLESADALQLVHDVERTATEDAIVDGYGVWFEAEFDEETTLTTSPLAPLTSWGNRMFRLDHEVCAGEVVRYRVDLGVLVEPSTWTVTPLSS